MQKRIAISACALVMFSVGAGNMLGQQTIGQLIRTQNGLAALETYTPSSASSDTAMSNCGTTAEQLKAEGYTEEYHFHGDEEIVSVEYCQNGSAKTDTRLRLVAEGTIGFMKPDDRTQVAFTMACKNRGVLKTPPPVPPTPVAPPVAFAPPPPTTPIPPTLIIEKEFLDISLAVIRPVPAFTFTVTGDSFTTTTQNGADGTVSVPLLTPGCYQVTETSGSTYELLGTVPADGKICLQGGEEKVVHFKNRQVVPPTPTAEVPPAETPAEPPTTFQIRRPFFTGGEEEEIRFCDRDHNFFVKATAVQVACHPLRTAIILTVACVAVGEGLTWGPCRGIHYLFTGGSASAVQKAATVVIHK